MLFSLNFARKGTMLPALKGNNSCRTYTFRIKSGMCKRSITFVHT